MLDSQQANQLEKQIGEEVQHLRLHANMSQAELGRAIGVTQHQIQILEAGRSTLTVRRLVAIADALGVGPAHLLRVYNPLTTDVMVSVAATLDEIGPLSSEDLRLAARIARIRNDADRRDIIASINRLVDGMARSTHTLGTVALPH